LLQSPDPDGPSVSEQQVAEYLQFADTDSKSNFFYISFIINYLFIDSGDISLDEFIAFINQNVPQGAYGLKSIFRTIGKREKKPSEFS
jgi:hypothetical protein